MTATDDQIRAAAEFAMRQWVINAPGEIPPQPNDLMQRLRDGIAHREPHEPGRVRSNLCLPDPRCVQRAKLYRFEFTAEAVDVIVHPEGVRTRVWSRSEA